MSMIASEHLDRVASMNGQTSRLPPHATREHSPADPQKIEPEEPQPSLPPSLMQGKIQVKVVSTSNELKMANAVRALVFLGEFGWSYKRTFDENDFSATHILAFGGDEPAGTVRLRWFADFARIERIAIRPEFRSLKMLNALAKTALRLCRKKGYTKVGGLAYPELLPFWARHGAKPCGPEMASDYGRVVPIIGTPRRMDDIRALTAKDAGRWDFEWDTFGWEGTGI
jgi:predicted GNAT family N-acyltransferase